MIPPPSPEDPSPDSAPSPRESPEGAGDTDYRSRLQSIFDDENTPHDEKIEAALHLGAERFGVDNAHLVRINPADGTHTVTSAIGPHPEVTEGVDTALSRTYCRETIARQRPLILADAEKEGWVQDPAYQRYEFATYLGAKVRTNGSLYGTVCFADLAPSDDITSAQTDFLERLADAIGREIASVRANGSAVPDAAVPSPENLLDRIQEVAEVGAWVYDSKADAVTGTTQLYRLLELPEEKTFDLETGLDFYPPAARTKVETAVQDCLDEGVPFDLTVPIVTAKGTRRWVRVRGQRHERGDHTFQMTGTLQDVSEQKEIEETLEEEREVLRRMYRVTADQESSLDEKIEQLLGLGREFLDLPYGFLTRIENDTQRIVKARGTHPLLQTGASCPLSKSYCRKTIQQKSLLAVQDAPSSGWASDPAFETFGLGAYIGAKVFVDGELYGTFCFAAHEARDAPFGDRERTFVELLSRWASYELERRQAAEQLEQRNERLDRLASVVSHDLRNPLNVAQGRLDLLQEQLEVLGGPVDAETEEHLNAVQRAHDRIDTIIGDMMALTWSSQSLDPDAIESLQFREVIEACWAQVETDAATLHVEDDGSLRADESRLRQLLENLLRNAVEHGGAEVTVRAGLLPGGFYVEDDGPGIPEEERDKVFEASYSTNETGTGLGLSIAKTVADAHGWTISATESVEGGARFVISNID